jgi:hypothetical protein
MHLEEETSGWGEDAGGAKGRCRPQLYENRARTFDPLAGGYLQVDPLVGSTWEGYSYAGHNPVENTGRRALVSMRLDGRIDLCERSPGHDAPTTTIDQTSAGRGGERFYGSLPLTTEIKTNPPTGWLCDGQPNRRAQLLCCINSCEKDFEGVFLVCQGLASLPFLGDVANSCFEDALERDRQCKLWCLRRYP